ncbi:hypothetical protein CRUP_020998 [Coryphaenoides rupestris]|nr:hypothetical protein CRUP_020998 [Coryphaenoides rupestris]
MKAMLLRHIFLKKAGHVGFMMTCSSSTRSSVNRWSVILADVLILVRRRKASAALGAPHLKSMKTVAGMRKISLQAMNLRTFCWLAVSLSRKFLIMSIFPVFLFSLLHATTYTKKVLDRLRQEGSAQLEVGQPLVQPQGAGQRVTEEEVVTGEEEEVTEVLPQQRQDEHDGAVDTQSHLTDPPLRDVAYGN